jgi:hypothetical protein
VVAGLISAPNVAGGTIGSMMLGFKMFGIEEA